MKKLNKVEFTNSELVTLIFILNSYKNNREGILKDETEKLINKINNSN